jgi:hypothetical protein
MANKPIIKKKDDVIARNEPGIAIVYLIIGPWKNLFPDEQNKILIAKALNACTNYGRMNIGGYLVTQRLICLVLDIDGEDIEAALYMFYDVVRKEVKQYDEWLKSPKEAGAGSREPVDVKGLLANMFTRYYPINEYLPELITGRTVNLPFYNPRLVRLKDLIRNYNYCSAIDYAGAIGPVKIKRIEVTRNLRKPTTINI